MRNTDTINLWIADLNLIFKRKMSGLNNNQRIAVKW